LYAPSLIITMNTDRDTIFALSSGRPPAAIAVIRICGPQAAFALERMIGRVPEPRRAALVRVRDPASTDGIDEGLALWFPAPHSETGEDMAELQIHGGRAVIAATLAALGNLPGLRHAEAGEFTRRAFENGRMDLTAVEGLADLIAAETQAQRRQAYEHLRGLLGERAESWRKRLIAALALVEAGIDFSDEDGVPDETMAQALELVAPLRDEIENACKIRGERLREGLRVAIAGPPNAGKSTLFNRLARREAAIVSPYPGTTRDVLELHLDFGGFPVTVLDTAGIRATDDPVEREGVRRARDQAARADLVLWVLDATASPSQAPCMLHAGLPAQALVWSIVNKIDLAPEPHLALPGRESAGRSEAGQRGSGRYFVSSTTGAGIDHLVDAIAHFCENYFLAEPALVARERQRAQLEECARDLRGAQLAAGEGREEIVAEQLRLAARALGKLLGRVDVEDILDVIFRDFCIGK
jgi:tRNA modification GTPase